MGDDGDARDLPHRIDPPEGFVASANNAPTRGAIAIGNFFSPDDRVRRLRHLLSEKDKLSRAKLARMQTDIHMPAALALRDSMLALIEECGEHPQRLTVALKAWDGGYDAASAGALAFELMSYHTVAALHGTENLPLYAAAWDPWALLREDLRHADHTRLRRAVAAACNPAERALRKFGTWGAVHRLRLSHGFGAAPVIGRRFRYADLPVGGSNETVMKTGFGFSGGRHAVKFGANARHISDLADLDENYFVLLGGQDGWLGSTTFLDQLPLWRANEAIRVPLRPEAIAAEFPYLTVLAPSETAIEKSAPGRTEYSAARSRRS